MVNIFCLLCKYIKENFDEIETLYLIGKGDDDLRISKYVQEYFINIEVVNLVDKIELADLHEYLLSSSQFFSFDSGLMHLSCFYNTNKYFVFGPTNRQLSFLCVLSIIFSVNSVIVLIAITPMMVYIAPHINA